MGFKFELINEKHTKFIIKWRNDPEININYLANGNISEKDQNSFLKNYLFKDRIDFILVRKIDDFPIGFFFVKNISFLPEIGETIGEKKFRGTGLGYKACIYFIDFLFLNLMVLKIIVKIKDSNQISIGFHKKLGFEQDKCLLKQQIRIFNLSKEKWLKIAKRKNL